MRGVRNLRLAGCSSNRLCCDTSKTQGSVSQRHAGRGHHVSSGHGRLGRLAMSGSGPKTVIVWLYKNEPGLQNSPCRVFGLLINVTRTSGKPYLTYHRGKKVPTSSKRRLRVGASTTWTRPCPQASTVKQTPLGSSHSYIRARSLLPRALCGEQFKVRRKGHTLPIWLPSLVY